MKEKEVEERKGKGRCWRGERKTRRRKRINGKKYLFELNECKSGRSADDLSVRR